MSFNFIQNTALVSNIAAMAKPSGGFRMWERRVGGVFYEINNE